MARSQTTIYRAGAIRDAGGPVCPPLPLPGVGEGRGEGAGFSGNATTRRAPIDLRPGAVAVSDNRIVAVGTPDAVYKEVRDQGPFTTIDLPDRLLLPALVNAHTHLDLTDIDPVPVEEDFIRWVDLVMKRRPRDTQAIRAAVHHGLKLSREQGVGYIGDIAGTDEAFVARLDDATANTPAIPGPSYLECFGIGAGQADAVRAARERYRQLHTQHSQREYATGVALSLQPHAPYSAGLKLYTFVTRELGHVSTHLAETRDELEFVRTGKGPFRDLLIRLGKWDESAAPSARSPVALLAPILRRARWTLAHCNYVDDADIAILADANAAVAYCPIASDYFGHRNHRYRDMLAAGVNVCLGTDSILCQPADEPQPMSILAQMRHLYRRDRTSPQTLLEMATWRGTGEGALARREFAPALEVGSMLGLIAVRFDPADTTDALTQVLANRQLVERIA